MDDALLEEVRQEWIGLGSPGQGEPDPEALRRGVSWLYEMAREAPPPFVLLLDSPLAARLAAVLFRCGMTRTKPPVKERWGLAYWGEHCYAYPDYEESWFWLLHLSELPQTVVRGLWERVSQEVERQLGGRPWSALREVVASSVRCRQPPPGTLGSTDWYDGLRARGYPAEDPNW